MRNQVFVSMMAMTAVVAVLSLAPAPAAGQAPAGKTEAYAPPRTPDGQPDFRGFWGAVLGGSYSIEDLELQSDAADFQGQVNNEREIRRKVRSRVVDPADGRIPYQPWARAKQQKIFETRDNPTPEFLDPRARCFLNGVPRGIHLGAFQIIQTHELLVIMFEDNHAYRIIPMDGRPHVPANIQLWGADSRGRWDENTLVIDVTNFNDTPRFDVVGNFHSDTLHVVERFTLVDADTIAYEATMEDPKVYTRPWTMAVAIRRIKEKGFELLESACHEGNHDVERLLRGSDTDKTGKANR